MKIKLPYKAVYLLGIGGIGMSALARYFKRYGLDVAGYDKTETPLTQALNKEGITTRFTENVQELSQWMSAYAKNDILVIRTPAIPADSVEWKWLMDQSYTIKKRSEVLGEISSRFKTIAIAGTHGKTTTSTLTAHLLQAAGKNVFAFLGGISKNYDTNLLLGDETKEDAIVVVEADEYDRSFLTLHPEVAVITSCDADHLDIYGKEEEVWESYRQFAAQVKEGGQLIVKKFVDNTLGLEKKHQTYAVTLRADYFAGNVRIENGYFYFDYFSPIENISALQSGLPGLHNVENAVAAIAAVQQLGLKGDQIREALRSFQGVKRRFDYHVRKQGRVYIDDYAHHPEELKATIHSVRLLYPQEKITGIFQPHLFSRTRDFVNEFAASLDMLDEVILLDIYPAREKPIPGVDSRWLLEKVTRPEKVVLQKTEVIPYLQQKKPQVLLTMGAGDIDSLIAKVAQCVSEM